MTARNSTNRWLAVALLGAGIAAVYACTDATFDEKQPRPSFAPGDIIGPAEVPRENRNDKPKDWSSTGIALTAGLPYRITASGMLTFTDNSAYHDHLGCTPHPTIPSSVGPAGFDMQNRPWAVVAGMGTETTAPPGAPLSFKPPLTASTPEMSALVKSPGGVLWVSRPNVLPWVCGGPGFDEPAWNVSGSQQIQATELELPNAVPDKLSVPVGDTVLFTLQVSWGTISFIGSGTGWRWVPDTTTNTSSLVNNCPRTQLTCKVIVREKGHVEVQNVNVEGMAFDARSPVIVIGAPQFTVTANPGSIASAQSVTFTAAVNTSLEWSLSSWTWTPDVGAGGIDPNDCTTSEKTCVRTISKAGWMKATAVTGPYTLTDSARVSFVACDPEVEIMIGEYQTYQVNLQPTCPDFTNTGGSTHFSWSELNGGFSNGNPHNPWGMVKSALTTGLEATRTNYNRGGISLSSGYRCPHGNNNVGGVPHSWHMHGRAADMYSSEHPWTEDEFNLLKTAAESTGPIESLLWTEYTDHHYHAAW